MITELRGRNRANLLRLRHLNGPTTCTKMAAHLGLTRSTITALVDQLAAAGIVVERPGDGQHERARDHDRGAGRRLHQAVRVRPDLSPVRGGDSAADVLPPAEARIMTAELTTMFTVAPA